MKEYASTEEFLADIQQMINNSISDQAIPMQSDVPSTLQQPERIIERIIVASGSSGIDTSQPERIIERIIVESGSSGIDTSARIMNILF